MSILQSKQTRRLLSHFRNLIGDCIDIRWSYETVHTVWHWEQGMQGFMKCHPWNCEEQKTQNIQNIHIFYKIN